MAKIMFVEHRFSSESESVLRLAHNILIEYGNKGYSLTLRQLYYQLVARGHIENSVRSYKRIGNLISDGRMAGLLDWNMIEDRNRETVCPSFWESPAEIIRTAAKSFRIDHWLGQPCYCEVMVEKDALSGILEPVCRELGIRFTANKGYSSSSAMFEAGKRFYNQSGKEKYLFYLGDHDPSGIDMTRDVDDRIELFSFNSCVEIHRLALNMDQVNEWNPPKNPAKETDSRFANYLNEFGESSWELDAVKPEELERLVRDNVEKLIDWDLWNEKEELENEMIETLNGLADQAEGE
jgi:hypothetical protein